jgi:hypothetical protein
VFSKRLHLVAYQYVQKTCPNEINCALKHYLDSYNSLSSWRQSTWLYCSFQSWLTSYFDPTSLSTPMNSLMNEDDCLLGFAPRSLVEVYRRFRGASCLHHQGEEDRRQSSSYSPPSYSLSNYLPVLCLQCATLHHKNCVPGSWILDTNVKMKCHVRRPNISFLIIWSTKHINTIVNPYYSKNLSTTESG